MDVRHEAQGTPPTLPRVDPMAGTVLTVLAACWIVRGEVDHLLAQVLDRGRTYSPDGLRTPFAPHARAAGWRFFRDRAGLVDGRVGGWLAAYAVVDVVLAALVLLVLLRAVTLVGPRAGGLRATAIGLVAVGSALRVVGDVLIGSGAHAPTVIAAADTVGWPAFVVGLVLVGWRARRVLGRWLRLAPHALYTHRYTAVIVLPLGLLGLGRGPDLLEQVPDIQRAWADPGQHLDVVAAGAVMALLVIACFVIGRQRTHHLWLRSLPDPPDRPSPALLVWFLGPALVVLAGVVLGAAGAPVAWSRVAVFAGIPFLVGAVSLALRLAPVHLTRPPRSGIGGDRFLAAAYVGDLLVGLLPVISGLGVIRAFTAVLALDGASGWALGLYVAAWVTLLACWPAWDLTVRRLARMVRPDRYGSPSWLDRLVALLTPGVVVVARSGGRLRRQWLTWAVLVIAFGSTVLVALLPVWLAAHFGVIATYQLALGSVSVLVAALVVLFQPGGAPEVFWPLRIAFVPTTTLIVVAMLFAAEVGGGADVHGIRPYAGADAGAEPDARPSLVGTFDTWLTAGASCAQDLPGASGLRVRPLLLYAAEGGGVRAAYWTASAVDRIATPDPGARAVCRSAFLSSGASGGSVGLSIASVRRPGTAGAAVRALAGPSALGAAADGLVVRDTVFAAAGLPVPSLDDPGIQGADWSDRATLIEQAWEHAVPQLRQPFLRDHGSSWDWGPTGALAINSTSTTTACRTLISQVLLPGTTSTECAPGQPAPGSTDLVDCTGQLRTTTAALLTARFPYVTPSGVVHCGDREMQIVDGGYAENFGIGTLDDLMPRLLGMVRRHNTCVLERTQAPAACTAEPARDTLVVPQLVYFDNGTGSDLTRQPGGLDLEVLVPPLTLLEAKGALYSARSQLQRAQAALATGQLWDTTAPASDTAITAVNRWRRNPIAVVYQSTRPSIAAPLGWVLSDASMRAMDAALCQQQDVENLGYGSETTQRTDTVRHRQFGTIDDILALLPGPSPAPC